MAVIKTIDLVGVSVVSWEDAAKAAVHEAAKTIRGLIHLDVLEWTGVLGPEGEIVEYHTAVRLHFRLER